jgi:hypothetical protein
MKSKTLISALWLILLLAIPMIAEETSDIQALGTSLVEKVWTEMKANNAEGLREIMADGFQSLHQDGSRNLEDQLVLIAGLSLGEYKLTDFKVTTLDNTMIVTYFVSVEETIDGERLDSEPAPRMSVFVRSGDDWKWLAHVNMKPMKK